jgi:hypothetical protein
VSDFTAATKLAAVERELKYRRRVYPRLIEEGRMSHETSKAQIAIFEDIAADYRVEAGKERLL